MKNIFLTVLAFTLIGLTSCESSSNEDILPADIVKNPATASSEQVDTRMPKMVFPVSEQDFGTIVQGTSVNLVYKFTNEGESDLIISSAKGSCGCTIPTWPKKPFKPGESGEIEVVFNSQGKKDLQNKKVYITANTSPANNVIVLKGNVVAPE